MANNRLWCAVVLVALSLIAESTAKPSGGSGEGDELKELLGAMKRYLLVKSSSSRTDAHDDVRTVYDSCKISSTLRYNDNSINLNTQRIETAAKIAKFSRSKIVEH